MRSRGSWMLRVAMMPGNRARETRQKRNERAAGQARGEHHAIEQERRARQIARFLEREDEEKQDQDLRQEHQHRAEPGEHAIDQQAVQRARRQQRRRSRCRAPRCPASIASCTGLAHENTAWKIRNITTASTASPSTGCSTTRSIASSIAAVRRGAAHRFGEQRAHFGVQIVVRCPDAGRARRNLAIEPLDERRACRRDAPRSSPRPACRGAACKQRRIDADAALARPRPSC